MSQKLCIFAENIVKMDIKDFIAKLGFAPKDGTTNIYHKIYANSDNYAINIDFGAKAILYGDKIQANSKTTQNFSHPENFVVLECVDRLIRKGYKPENIILEKTWPSGHGTSGRLDICVNKEDGNPYLLIECKTAGKEFNKELNKIRKDGGQIFTYFQLSGHKADILMLYSSDITKGKENYRNEIIKIEEEYRNGEVKDIFEKWNKLTKDNGIFDSWVNPYNFQNKALTKAQLKEITDKDSSFIFNRFKEILRHHVVSDNGNAFNKIFTLFLCKVYDETTTDDGEELKFQWLEGRDNHVDFQLRLTDLYSKGMKKFLDRTVSDFNDDDFEQRCATLSEDTKEYLRQQVNKLRLEKNNEFAIKEVYDPASFEENAKVVKEVVELLQGYRIRYNKRQQYLSDFFELLLTTGLKQEAGQFFTPVPIAQFIIKSLPIDSIVKEKLSLKEGEILPYMIDYASGSGHFITEYMHEVQDIIDNCDPSKYISETRGHIANWKNNHFDWATTYVYGIEKDYRLVKVGKVGCYLHGDGLANVILGDGLANFNNKEYKGKLHKNTNDGQKDNQQFDILLSNPPYAIPSFRQTTRDYYTEKDFELYDTLTDNSKEIECLFIERAKQLLKQGGVAGIILPSTILSNDIYTKAREIILLYFDIIGIVELGSNTFMATNTSTVVLFLRRRNNYFYKNTLEHVNTYFKTYNDVTINGIETPATKYVTHVWEGLDYKDYITLLQKSPNDKVISHEIYLEYKKRFKVLSETKFLEVVLNIETEKLLYFILAYPQNVVVIKSGEKEIEKKFLGYEFSNRRGKEGIHAIQRGEKIDECTKLYDSNKYDNPNKASSYIYRAFKGDFSFPIADCMKNHIYRSSLVDMLAFDNSTFEKKISTSIKKKIQVKSKHPLVPLGDVAYIERGVTYSKEDQVPYKTHIVIMTADNITLDGQFILKKEIYLRSDFNIDTNKYLKAKDCFICLSSGSKEHVGKVAYIENNTSYLAGGFMGIIRCKSSEIIPKYLFEILNLPNIKELIKIESNGDNIKNLSSSIGRIKIPLPPKEIQKNIINEIELVDKRLLASNVAIKDLYNDIVQILNGVQGKKTQLSQVSPFVTTSIKIDDIQLETYVTTDNMLQNRMGVVAFEGTANINSITQYQKGDILISNIRPYLKKIWYADKDGGCSKDVLVLRSSDESKYHSKYIYYMLCRDAFFDYVMEGKKGLKMPRGNKEDIQKYQISVPSIAEQKRIVALIDDLQTQIAKHQSVIDNAAEKKSKILEKYL